MAKEVEDMLAEKGSLEREFLELVQISDEMNLNNEIMKNSMLMNIAHSLAVIADALSHRAEQTEPKGKE